MPDDKNYDIEIRTSADTSGAEEAKQSLEQVGEQAEEAGKASTAAGEASVEMAGGFRLAALASGVLRTAVASLSGFIIGSVVSAVTALASSLIDLAFRQDEAADAADEHRSKIRDLPLELDKAAKAAATTARDVGALTVARRLDTEATDAQIRRTNEATTAANRLTEAQKELALAIIRRREASGEITEGQARQQRAGVDEAAAQVEVERAQAQLEAERRALQQRRDRGPDRSAAAGAGTERRAIEDAENEFRRQQGAEAAALARSRAANEALERERAQRAQDRSPERERAIEDQILIADEEARAAQNRSRELAREIALRKERLEALEKEAKAAQQSYEEETRGAQQRIAALNTELETLRQLAEIKGRTRRENMAADEADARRKDEEARQKFEEQARKDREEAIRKVQAEDEKPDKRPESEVVAGAVSSALGIPTRPGTTGQAAQDQLRTALTNALRDQQITAQEMTGLVRLLESFLSTQSNTSNVLANQIKAASAAAAKAQATADRALKGNG